jgi:DNA ligase-associated metallophosphoesterase
MAHVYEFSLGGTVCVADGSGALYLPATGTLVVADMHLEKSSHFAARGQYLPPYESATTLARLVAVISHFDPRTVVALGDSFHDSKGHIRLHDDNRRAILAMQSGRDWLWIAGNHDPDEVTQTGGIFSEDNQIDGVMLRHIPADDSMLEIAGHLHPVARVVLRGHGIQRRCFIHDDRRVVLPAFGAYTGGMDIRNEQFARLFPSKNPAIYLVSA